MSARRGGREPRVRVEGREERSDRDGAVHERGVGVQEEDRLGGGALLGGEVAGGPETEVAPGLDDARARRAGHLRRAVGGRVVHDDDRHTGRHRFHGGRQVRG